MSGTEILEQIRNLPEAERRELVERIENEFNDELSPAQIAELERRADEFRKNPQDSVPWEQARDGAHQRFGWK